MANKHTNKTSFSKDNQPKNKRGKTERVKILEAMERAGKTEDGFYDLLVERSLNVDDNFTFKELLSRVSPVTKAVSPNIEFDFPEEAKPHEQAVCVMAAIAAGKIPPDLGATFISSIKHMIDIEEYTDLKARIESIEKALSISND